MGAMSSFARSSRIRRICWPMGVPPGSTFSRTECPSCRSRAASNFSCVDLPLPSPPSKLMKRPPPLVISEMQNFLQVFPCFPFCLLIVLPQQVRRMIRNHQRDFVPLLPLAAHLRNPEFAANSAFIAVAPARKSPWAESPLIAGTETVRRFPSRPVAARGSQAGGTLRHCKCKRRFA